MSVTFNLSEGEIAKPDLSYFDGFIGQKSVIKKLKFFIMSSLDVPFPSLLLTGSHGLGKTFLAEKIAKSLGRKFISINCGSIKKKEDFINSVVLSVDGPTTIFFDEAHSLSKEITTVLLSLLNPTSDNANMFTHDGVNFMHDLKRVNVMFATTDAHAMFKPLKNRCYPVYFSPYSDDSVVDILKLYLGKVDLKCNLTDVAESCRSRARDAFLLAQNMKRYISVSGAKAIGPKEWKDIKDTFEIFPKGLNREEVNLLRVVKDFGPISCANLALKLMVNEDNVKEELEVIHGFSK
jgi:Holliday junction resolvasome RuvABC ATP-dependent DNA helicase subunit